MRLETFEIQFSWRSSQRWLEIRAERPVDYTPVLAIYQVYWNSDYLFSVYPTFNEDCNKTWKILETERASHLPAGFLSVLGGKIDEAYVMSE